MEEKKEVLTVEQKEAKEKRFKRSLFIRFSVWFSKQIMWLLWPTKILFKERFNIDGRAIVMCNHYCKLDTNPIIRTYYKHKKFKVLLKEELMEGNGFIPRFLEEIGAIPVTRGTSDVTAVKRVLRALKNDEQLIIYPEGTRNKAGTKEMLPLKEGTAMFAIKTKSPLVPMLHYAKGQWYKRNYFIVGKPFTLEQFYNEKSIEAREDATKYIEQKYAELRQEVDEIVEKYHGSVKKYLKAKNSEQVNNK